MLKKNNDDIADTGGTEFDEPVELPAEAHRLTARSNRLELPSPLVLSSQILSSRRCRRALENIVYIWPTFSSISLATFQIPERFLRLSAHTKSSGRLRCVVTR